MAEMTMPSSGSTSYDYIWFAGQPVAQVDITASTTTTHWTFTDHLGTPLIQTDSTGAIDWRAEHEPYGKVYTLRAGATRHQPLRFPGQEAGTSETSYNIFRWYRAGWGRYTQADPAGVSSDLNLYRYAAGAPTDAIDPLGLQLYVPRYPSNAAPRGCRATAWTYAGSQEREYRSRSVWELVDETPIEPGYEGAAEGGGAPGHSVNGVGQGRGGGGHEVAGGEGHIAISCLCTYRMIGVKHYIERWDKFSRTVCCNGWKQTELTRTLSARGSQFESVWSSEKRTAHWPAAGGQCLCPEEYEP